MNWRPTEPKPATKPPRSRRFYHPFPWLPSTPILIIPLHSSLQSQLIPSPSLVSVPGKKCHHSTPFSSQTSDSEISSPPSSHRSHRLAHFANSLTPPRPRTRPDADTSSFSIFNVQYILVIPSAAATINKKRSNPIPRITHSHRSLVCHIS